MELDNIFVHYGDSSQTMSCSVLLAAKNRGIAIPVDLDSQVNTLFSKSQIVMKHTRQWLNVGRNRRDSTMTISRDYRSIIEGLQVCYHRQSPIWDFEVTMVWKVITTFLDIFSKSLRRINNSDLVQTTSFIWTEPYRCSGGHIGLQGHWRWKRSV